MHASSLFVLVEAERLEVVQRARGLRDGEAVRVPHIAGERIGGAGVVFRGVPEKRHEIARGRQSDRGDDRILGRVPELVDVALLERGAGRQQADGLLVDVLPVARGQRRRLVVQARPYRQRRLGLVQCRRGIGEVVADALGVIEVDVLV